MNAIGFSIIQAADGKWWVHKSTFSETGPVIDQWEYEQHRDAVLQLQSLTRSLDV